MLRIFRHLTTFCMLALIPAPIACASDTSSARAFLEKVYAPYAAGGSLPDPLGAEAPSIFASPLLALIRSDQQRAGGEVGLLDHDPICRCQDFENLRITDMHFEQLDSERLRATVSLANFGKLTNVRFILAEEHGDWLIADVQEPGIPSLAHFLQKGLAKAPPDTNAATQD